MAIQPSGIGNYTSNTELGFKKGANATQLEGGDHIGYTKRRQG
jgi:hypothetical protein